jgi:hypothetical protein
VVVSQPWRAGSAVRGSGGSGLAKRAITAATAIAILVVVATAMTTVAVLVVVLVSVAIIADIATAGRVRRRGGWWPSCRGHSVGVERRWDSRRSCTIHVDRPELSRRVAPNNGAHVLEALVQPLKNVEDEDPIFNGGT